MASTVRGTKRALCVLLFVVFLSVLAIGGTYINWRQAYVDNYGFGPEWDCVNPGKLSGLSPIASSGTPRLSGLALLRRRVRQRRAVASDGHEA